MDAFLIQIITSRFFGLYNLLVRILFIYISGALDSEVASIFHFHITTAECGASEFIFKSGDPLKIYKIIKIDTCYYFGLKSVEGKFVLMAHHTVHGDVLFPFTRQDVSKDNSICVHSYFTIVGEPKPQYMSTNGLYNWDSKYFRVEPAPKVDSDISAEMQKNLDKFLKSNDAEKNIVDLKTRSNPNFPDRFRGYNFKPKK
jgi:hypothetical protein